MKKLILLILLILPIVAKAQEKPRRHGIADERASQGLTYIQDYYSQMGDNWAIRPEIFVKGDSVIMRLISVRVPFAYDIESGSPILIKISDGSVVEGKCIIDAEYMPRGYSSISQWVMPVYEFSPEDLAKIKNFGITKIRLSAGTKMLDKDIPKTSSDFVIEGFDFLEKYANNKPSIYDNF